MTNYHTWSTEDLKVEIVRLKENKKKAQIVATASNIEADIRKIARILNKRLF